MSEAINKSALICFRSPHYVKYPHPTKQKHFTRRGRRGLRRVYSCIIGPIFGKSMACEFECDLDLPKKGLSHETKIFLLQQLDNAGGLKASNYQSRTLAKLCDLYPNELGAPGSIRRKRIKYLVDRWKRYDFDVTRTNLMKSSSISHHQSPVKQEKKPSVKHEKKPSAKQEKKSSSAPSNPDRTIKSPPNLKRSNENMPVTSPLRLLRSPGTVNGKSGM